MPKFWWQHFLFDLSNSPDGQHSDSMSCSVEFIRRVYCRCYECIVCTYSFVHTIFYLITNLTITTKYQAISHLVRPRTVRQNSYWNPNNINFSQNFIRSYMRRVIYLWTCLTAHKSCITNRKPRPLSFQSEWIKQLRFSHWPLAATHKNYTKCNWILHQKIPRIKTKYSQFFHRNLLSSVAMVVVALTTNSPDGFHCCLFSLLLPFFVCLVEKTTFTLFMDGLCWYYFRWNSCTHTRMFVCAMLDLRTCILHYTFG